MLDEPTSSLDASVQAQILLLLEKLQSEFDITYMLITHNTSVAKYITDRIAVMYLGKFMEMGKNEQVLENPMHPYTKLLIASVLEPGLQRILSDPEIAKEVVAPLRASACRFSNRCPYAKEICFSEQPKLREIESEHFVACHLVEEFNVNQ